MKYELLSLNSFAPKTDLKLFFIFLLTVFIYLICDWFAFFFFFLVYILNNSYIHVFGFIVWIFNNCHWYGCYLLSNNKINFFRLPSRCISRHPYNFPPVSQSISDLSQLTSNKSFSLKTQNNHSSEHSLIEFPNITNILYFLFLENI